MMEDSTDLWDVIVSNMDLAFNQDYIKKERGSFNPINSKIEMEPDKEILKFAESLNLIDLYALELQLNLFFRNSIDFIRSVSAQDNWKDTFNNDLKQIIESYFEKDNLKFENLSDFIEEERIRNCKPIWDMYWDDDLDELIISEDIIPEASLEFRKLAKFQFSIQYFIETSKFDYRTKAEAFLRSGYYSNFKFCDTEVLIHIITKDFISSEIFKKTRENSPSYNDIKNAAIEEACFRWEKSRERWSLIAPNTANPFKTKPDDFSKLRFIYISKLSVLNEYIYEDKYHTKHAYEDYFYVINCLRTDWSAIKNYLPTIIEHLEHKLVFSKNICFPKDFNPNDFIISYDTRMMLILYFFLLSRFSNDITDKYIYENYSKLLLNKTMGFESTNNPNGIRLRDETDSIIDDDNMVDSLDFLNAIVVWLIKPEGYKEYLKDMYKKIIECNEPYGYWSCSYMGTGFMTVLALDAIDTEIGKLTHPLNKISLSKCKLINKNNEENKDGSIPYVEYDAISRMLTVGTQKITLSTSRYSLMEELITLRFTGLPLTINKKDGLNKGNQKKYNGMKNALDYLRKQLKNKKHLKYVIESVYVFNTSTKGYQLAPNVRIKNSSSVHESNIPYDENTDQEYDDETIKKKFRK